MFVNEIKKKTNHPPSPLQNVSPATKVHNIESVPSGLPPEEKSDHVLMGKKIYTACQPHQKSNKNKDRQWAF